MDRVATFDDRYNTKNITDIHGRSYDLLVSAGAPAVKWIANSKPEEDRAILEGLMDNLRQVKASRFVLISTIDVYPVTAGVDECTPIERGTGEAYGSNRLALEDFVRAQFKESLILRLPALFGEGLKKNVIFDLLHHHEVQKIHQDGVFQFYPLTHLWKDLQRALEQKIHLLNMVTEPLSVRQVAMECFGMSLENALPPPAPLYDAHTIHADTLRGKDGYLYSKEYVLRELTEFVRSQRHE